MIPLLLTMFAVFVLLVITEYFWRIKKYRSEFTRKFMHISVGTFAATWPLFLSWEQIELLAFLFVVGVVAARTITILTKVFSVFGSVHLIGRKTLGELFFSLGIGATAIATHNPWIFAAAMLHVSLADGLAAIIGTKYGKNGRYRVFGQTKSIVGSVTFLVVSELILGLFVIFNGSQHGVLTLLAVSPLAMLVENIGGQGTDNFLIPLVIAMALQRLT